MRQHASLSPDRWSGFSKDQQLLMIANEMNRASKLVGAEDRERLRNAYARVLQLTDLTIGVRREWGLRRELLRWRDLVAALWLQGVADPEAHRQALHGLLRMSFQASRQIPHLMAEPPAARG